MTDIAYEFQNRLSRRRFLHTAAGAFAGSWALSHPFARRLSSFSGLPGPLSAHPFFAFPGASGLPGQTAGPGSKWTALNQALARFDTHRFACERRFQALAPSLERFRASLLSGGQGLHELLSPRFQGLALTSGRETILRQDTCFDVRRTLWGGNSTAGHLLDAGNFTTDLERFLAPHAPLALADLECTAINKTTNRPAAGSSDAPGNLSTHLRVELANTSRWQTTGEWEIEWELADTSSWKGPATPTGPTDWRIVGWRPLAMTSVQASAFAFTDVTADAFGQDPSYAAHLLRDTNYWRAVLDEASGIDIFGNYGVSVADIDGDGRDEIYMCQPQGLPNRLYRQSRPGVFEDIAPHAGVDFLDATPMALFADLLNRGHQDLILITQSAPLLFRNDGHGKFTLVREGFPPSPQQASLTSAALGDYDRDGFLDLYVCSYGYFQGQGATRVPLPYYDAQNGPPNHLYRNRGDGTFVDVTTASGLEHGNNRFSFACVWADIDDDGWLDLCVVNDFGRNNLYHNRRDGTFEEIADGLPGYGAGMSAAFADLDRDGLGELYAAGMWQPVGERVSADPEFQQRFADVGVEPLRDFAMGSNLYHTTPATATTPTASSGHEEAVPPKVSPKMAAVPEAAGARRAFWNWCADAFDLENDGWLDIYCLNGFLSSPTPDLAPLDAYLWEEVMALSPHTNTPSAEYRAAWAASFDLAHRGHPWDGGQRNVCFLNLGAGRFADASAAVGLNFPDDSRSFAVLDYDGDGDADIVIHSRTGPQLRLLRNEIGHKNRSLAIRLTGIRSNRDAIGARVEVETPSGRQVRFLSCGSGFLAQHSKELIFGLGNYSQGIKARVRWPRGGVSEFADLSAGNRYHLIEGQPNPRAESLATADSAGARSARSEKGTPPLPARFSAVLVDPLPMPSLGAIGLFDELAAKETTVAPQAVRAHQSHRYALLWLWDSAQTEGGKLSQKGEDAPGLETLLELQGRMPTRLVLWRNGSLPPRAAQQLEVPAWRANERFRLFWSTVLTHLFDYRREPPLPTGLLFEVGPDATQDPAGLASFRKLVKLYWGGADAEEILRDAHSGVPSGAAALPFPGRSLLCSFGRDFRSLGAVLPAVAFPGAAEIYLAQIVEDSPGDAEAQYNLALSRREIGKTELALSGVRAALAARPEFPEAENLLGVLLSQSRQLPEARLHLEKATQQAPDFAEAWNNLGYTLLLQGELAAAGEALQKALSLAPDFPDALDNLGIVMARQHNLDRAGELFRRALELQPENEQAANNLGVLYAQQGKTQDAVATFRALLQHNPEASSAVLNLAKLELSLGDDSEARRLLSSWLARHADDAAARKLLDHAQVKR
jgi:Flp pilus assembly protein TadD